MTSWQKAKETTDQKVRGSNPFGRTPLTAPQMVRVKRQVSYFVQGTALNRGRLPAQPKIHLLSDSTPFEMC